MTEFSDSTTEMLSTMHTEPTTFAAIFLALYAAHQIADHWVQTEHQAAHKGLPGWPGRLACAGHVLSYGITGLVAITAATWALGLTLNPAGLAAGMAVNMGTHYLADRRTPLRWMARIAGHSGFYALGQVRPGRDDNPSLGTGAYAMDQSWHIAWLFVAALIIA